MTIKRVKVRRVGPTVPQPRTPGFARLIQAQRTLYRAAMELNNAMGDSGVDVTTGYPFDRPFDSIVSDLVNWSEITDGAR